MIAFETNKISVLFSKGKFVIPTIQRGYKWSDKQCQTMVEDFYKAWKTTWDNDSEKEYFLGTIMICQTNGKLDVYDGQQRIISMFLLLTACYHWAKVKTTSRATSSNLEKFLILTDVDNIERNEPRIDTCHENLNNLLLAIFDEKFSFIPENHSLLENYKVFLDFLKEKEKETKQNKNIDIKEFINFICAKVRVGVITSSDQKECLEYFINVNTKGVDLEYYETLFGMLSVSLKDRGIEEGLRKIWYDEIFEHSLFRSNGTNEERKALLKYFVLSFWGCKSDKNEVYGNITESEAEDIYAEKIKTFKTDEDTKEFIDNFRTFFSFYEKLILSPRSKSSNNHFENKNHQILFEILRGTSANLYMPVITLLNLGYSFTSPEVKFMFKYLEFKKLCSHNIGDKELKKQLNTLCINLHKKNEKGELNVFLQKNAEIIEKEIEKFFENHLPKACLLSKRKTPLIINRDHVKYIYFKVESYIRNTEKELGFTVNSFFEKEENGKKTKLSNDHIFPLAASLETPEEYNLCHLSELEREILFNKIGNLTPLLGKQNSKAGSSFYGKFERFYRNSDFMITRSALQTTKSEWYKKFFSSVPSSVTSKDCQTFIEERTKAVSNIAKEAIVKELKESLAALKKEEVMV